MIDTEVSPGTGSEPDVDVALFVYGVVPADRELPSGLTGADGDAVRTLVHEGLAAVVSEHAHDRPPGRRRELVTYSEVLDALHSDGTVLPVRFGTVLPDEGAVVAELLAARATVLADGLAGLAGCSQFNVRAQYLEEVVLSEVVSENEEVARLRASTRDLPEDVAYGERVRLGELVARAVEQKQAQDAEAMLAPVLTHTVDHVLRTSGGLDRLLDVGVLVTDDARDAFEAELEDLAEAVHERIRVQLLGPMAPYDFVPEL